MTNEQKVSEQVTQTAAPTTTVEAKPTPAAPAKSADAKQPVKTDAKGDAKGADNRAPRVYDRNKKPNKFNRNANDPFEERVISIKRVIKVTKGGRKFKFSALVVVGDKKGRVGYATAKSTEVPEAIKKASRLAKKNLFAVKIVGEQKTIPHEWIGHRGAARVMLKPAAEGKGIVASDVVRAVVELAGIRNIYSKNLGTNNPQAVVLATINALDAMRTKEQIEKLRDKKL